MGIIQQSTAATMPGNDDAEGLERQLMMGRRGEDRLGMMATRAVQYFLHWGFLVCREMVVELEAGLEAADGAGDGSSSPEGTRPRGQLWDHVAQSLSRSSQAHGSALHRMAKREAAAATRSPPGYAMGAGAAADAAAAPPPRRTLTLSDLRASLGNSSPRTSPTTLCSTTRLVLRPASGGHLGCIELRVGDLVRLSPMPRGMDGGISDDDGPCPCGHDCTVAEVDFTCVTLDVTLPAIHNPPGRLWRLDQLGSLSTFSHTMRALESCCSQALVEKGAGSSSKAGGDGGSNSSSSLLQIILGTWHQGRSDSPKGEGGGGSSGSASSRPVVAPDDDDDVGCGLGRDRVLGNWQDTPAFPDLPLLPQRNASLVGNESQCRAAGDAASNRLVLIHGPPGTGKVRPSCPNHTFRPPHSSCLHPVKLCPVASLRTRYPCHSTSCQTTTIVQALLLMLQQRLSSGQEALLPVLVVAQTNVAVDNILDRLLSAEGGVVEELLGPQEGLPSRLPRVGDLSSVRKSLQKYVPSPPLP